MRVIALDPGKLTGWAAVDIDDVGEWSDLAHGILPAKQVVLGLFYAQWDDYLGHPGPLELVGGRRPAFDVIVYEDWVLYRGHVEEYVGSDMPYSQQIGQYRLIAWLSDTKIVKHPASRKNLARKQARAWWPELAATIEDIERRAHKDAHDGDALLHLFAYTLDHYPVRKHT